MNSLSNLFSRLSILLLLVGQLFSATLFAETQAVPVTSATATTAIMEERLANIERLLASNRLLSLVQQLELLQQELAELHGEIEVNNHKLEQMGNRQRALYTDIDRRLQTIESRQTPIDLANTVSAEPYYSVPDATEQKQPLQTAAQTSEITDVDVSESNTKISTVAIQAEYQRAFGLLKESKYEQAIKKLGKFLQTYPESEYADNAQYWLAEALYVTRQYQDAIKRYKELIKNYPNSPKIASSLLKIGYSQQAMGATDKAKLWYVDIKRRFPGSTEARLAADRLKRINDS